MSLVNDEYGCFESKGQLIFRPLNQNFDTKAYDDVKHHEVFIDRLPVDLYLNELLPFLCRIGPVYQIRIIMNFSGLTKGRAFVVFAKVKDAYRAVETLNGQLIRANHQPVKVTFSVNNRRLHLYHIPPYKTSDQLFKELNFKGLINIKVFKPISTNPFVYVTNEAIITFENHQFAASARRMFVSGSIILDGFKLKADWAKPKDFQTLFVLYEGQIDEQTLRNLFQTTTAQIFKIIFKNNKVFIKYKTFQMASYIYNIYSEFQFPIILYNGAKILKIDWPNRK